MRRNSFYSVLSVFLAGIVGFGACVLGFVSRDDNGKWFKNSNLSKWHWADAPVEKPKDNTDDKKDDAHLHTYDLTKWGFNAEEHFRQASCGHEEVIGRGKHDYAKIAGKDTCTVCGYVKGTISTSDFVIGQTDEDDGIALTSLEYESGEFADMGFPSNTIAAYRLTATVKTELGSTVCPQLVNFSVNWILPKPANAIIGDGSVDGTIKIVKVADNSADIICINQFDCPIELKISVPNSDVNTTLRLDFVRRLSSTSLLLRNSSYDCGGIFVPNIESVSYIGIGTVTGTFIGKGVSFNFTDDFMNAIKNSIYFAEWLRIVTAPVDQLPTLTVNWPSGNSVYVSPEKFSYSDSVSINFDISYILKSFMESSLVTECLSRNESYFRYAVIDAANKCLNAVAIAIFNDYCYAGKKYSSVFIGSTPNPINASSIGALPKIGSVEVDSGNFAF